MQKFSYILLIMIGLFLTNSLSAQTNITTRLNENRKFLKGDLGGIWEAVRPVRWGDSGEQKMVKVYSNCEEAELFLNGKSRGIRKRNGQDFPAAGLRWNVV